MTGSGGLALLQSVVDGAEVSGLALELWITDDNAQLALMHLYTWQVTGGEFFRTVVEETLDYVVRETLAPVQLGPGQQSPSNASGACARRH